jgi:puromycin-sensitive aminopeptidase
VSLGKNFRLTHDIEPRRYRIDLKIDLGNDTFAGSEVIEVEVKAPTDTVTLHALDLDVATATVRREGRSLAAAAMSTDAESQTLTLTFPAPLTAGTHALALTWTGRFSPGLRGLYRASTLAVTQFEAADARRLLPCFDEPAFKAVWEISLRDVPDGLTAISNGRILRDEKGPDGHRFITFAPTPVMSSYLVALVVGPLGSSEPVDVRGAELRTWAVPEKRHLTAFAQTTAAAVLPLLEDYFGRPYAFGKVDQIGIPDFEAGAMENAGAITFREVALLLDPATAPLSVQKRVAEVITHELAHQWFGNLVTMVWWDDLWLNEAFATWMAYKIVDAWRPDWRIWMDFEGGRGAALALDALQSTHAIRADIKNAEEAGESFDAITYEKGGAVLRMIEGYLGADRFREGIRRYMQRHQFGNAVADDLWRALGEASGEPVLTLANEWISKLGYPLVTASLRERDGHAFLHLSQRRFFADPSAREDGPRTNWLVPVVIRFADDEGIKTARALLDDVEREVPLPNQGRVTFAVANGGATGFFRVAYDEPTWQKLLPHVAAIDPVERIALLTDQWTLVRAGVARVEPFLDLVFSLATDPDPFVIEEVVSRLAVIEHRHLADDARDAFRRRVAEAFGPTAAPLGWGTKGEPDEARLRRAAVLRALVGLAQDPAAVAEAARRFELGEGAGYTDANLLDLIVGAAARTADDARVRVLEQKAKEEKDPAAKRRYLHALARVENPQLVTRAVERALEEDVPMQDFTSYLSVLLANRATREQAFALIRDRQDEVRKKADSPMLLRRLVEALGNLTERRHLTAVESLLALHPVEGAKQATAQTLERLRMDVSLRERILPAISGWLVGH